MLLWLYKPKPHVVYVNIRHNFKYIERRYKIRISGGASLVDTMMANSNSTADTKRFHFGTV